MKDTVEEQEDLELSSQYGNDGSTARGESSCNLNSVAPLSARLILFYVIMKMGYVRDKGVH